MSRIIKFAIATAMRQEEICRVTWSDLNTRTKMLTIRDRKDPRAKKGNDMRIPLLAVSGYDALALDEATARTWTLVPGGGNGGGGWSGNGKAKPTAKPAVACSLGCATPLRSKHGTPGPPKILMTESEGCR